MATVIDALILELGLDAKGLNQGTQQAKKGLADTKKEMAGTAKEADKMANSAVKSFLEIGKAAATMMIAFAGFTGLTKLVGDVTSANAELGLLSKNLGMSTEAISSWKNAAELSGGSAEGMESSLRSLSKAQTELAVTGNTGALPYFNALGVSLLNAQGKARPMGEVLLDLSKSMEGMDRQTAFNFAQNLGLDEGTVNTLLQGRAAVLGLVDAQKELHQVSAEDAAQSAELKQEWTKLKQLFASIGLVLVQAVTPVLIGFFKAINNVFRLLNSNKGVLKVIALAFTAIGVAVAALMMPFGVISTAIAAVGTAIILLIDDFQVWRRGGESALGGFYDFWAKGWDNAKKNYKGTIQSLKDDWQSFIDLLKAAWGLIVTVTTGRPPKPDQQPVVEPQQTNKVNTGNLSPEELSAGSSNIDKNSQYHKESKLKGSDGLPPIIRAKSYGENVEDAFNLVKEKAGELMGNIEKTKDNLGRETSQALLKLTPQDVKDLVKLASTEVVPSLKGENLYKQTAGVVDTVLNRAMSGKWGKRGDIRSVINARHQFSKISGLKDAYGSVQNMPDNAVNKKVERAVLEHLANRSLGQKSIVDNNLNYANENHKFSSKNNWGWIDRITEYAKQNNMRFGAGEAVHVHGTTDDLKRYKPAPFNVMAPIPQASQAASMANNAQQVASNTNNNTTTSHNSQNEVHVGKVEIVTQATDAMGIANEIAPALKNNNLINQINTGQS